jgi:hypothetical protein
MRTSKVIAFEWAKYFGLATIIIEWGGLILMFKFLDLSTSLPISQVSSPENPARPWAFMVMLAASISYSLASLYYNNFYKKSFAISLVAGLFFSVSMLLPYNKCPWSFMHILAALACFSLYIYMIYGSSNSEILASSTRILFKLICVLETILILAVVFLFKSHTKMVLPLELSILAFIHIWPLVLFNYKPRQN